MKGLKRIFLLTGCASSLASPPPDIPGEDMTEQYNQELISADSIETRTPAFVKENKNWLDKAMATWEAPPVQQQMSEDATTIPMGLGAVFVPRMTESGQEPEVEIIDSVGNLIARGKPGRAFPALPGTYFALIGSGSHQQAMVRTISVEDSRITPIVPDWAALNVEVVNEDNIPFRGEFELARVDKFEPYGRGFGPDPDLGEKPETWLLTPGLYKIFSVGDGYNTVRNFITVQLLAGRMTRILLVEDENLQRVVGGGIVDIGRDKVLASHWKYGLDLGGGALFNAVKDHKKSAEGKSNTTQITLLLNAWIRYDKSPMEWSTNLRINEGFSFSFVPDSLFDNLVKSDDDARLRSLHIWRLLPWVGPYGRFEIRTRLFPTSELREEEQDRFVIINHGSNIPKIDSISQPLQIDPSLSPFDLETGIGANLDLISKRYFESGLRTGFGYSFSSVRDKLNPITKSDLSQSIITAMPDSTVLDRAQILENVGSDRIHEAGPEAAITGDIRIGRWAVSKTEVKVFAPLAPEVRITRPDVFLETSLNWRLARAVTLDYRYNYSLKQPKREELQENLSVHRIQLRYSFSSR